MWIIKTLEYTVLFFYRIENDRELRFPCTQFEYQTTFELLDAILRSSGYQRDLEGFETGAGGLFRSLTKEAMVFFFNFCLFSFVLFAQLAIYFGVSNDSGKMRVEHRERGWQRERIDNRKTGLLPKFRR